MLVGRFEVLKLYLTVCDHDFIIDEIEKHIQRKKKFLVSPLASQTFVLAYYDRKLQSVLNKFDYLFSDSLWVKKSVNFLYNLRVKERIRGSNLMLRVCELAQKHGLKIFLYGTTQNTLDTLVRKLRKLYPKLKITGSLPSKFRDLRSKEKQELLNIIERSKANILFIGLGSPRQEIFSYNLLFKEPKVQIPLVVIPFGAAFDFVSEVKPTAPKWMQEVGLEWLFRLICEPKRLWKRYLIFGSLFVILVFLQKITLAFNSLHNNSVKSRD